MKGYAIARMKRTELGLSKQFLSVVNIIQDCLTVEWGSATNFTFPSLREARRFIARYAIYKAREGIFIVGPRKGFYPLSNNMKKWL